MTGAQLRAWRNRRRWSRTEAAKALGLSPDALSNYESGLRRDASRTPVVIPLAIELACAALDLGITSYDGSGELMQRLDAIYLARLEARVRDVIKAA